MLPAPDPGARQGPQLLVRVGSGALALGSPPDDSLGASTPLDEALERLASVNERLSQVIECRYFGGLTTEETAEALGMSTRSVERDWVKARGWLRLELGG